MRGRHWLAYFFDVIEKEYEKRGSNNTEWSDKEWTEFLGLIMQRVAAKINCWVAQRRPDDKENSYEWLNIDAMFFEDYEYAINDAKEKYDPFVLPRAIVELENSYDVDKITYCVWKILCIRSSIRVLICYQESFDKIEKLKGHLESIIWEKGLMKGEDSDLLILIGDEASNSDISWNDYYKVYEWRGDKLLKIEI